MTDRANVVEGGPSVLRVLALFALGALTLLSFAPIGAGVLAGSVASAAGCTLDEGSVHPCLVLGHDVGDALYTGFVLTWLAFVTWPGMLVALGLWTWVLVRGLRKRAAPRGDRVSSMTLQDLRYLVALIDHGHFGRAAESCNVSQPTLSTQIKKLEAQLGVTLVERTNKSVHVTPVGEEVVARARQILFDVEAIASVGRRVAGPLSGALSLGVIPTLGPYLLPWLVPALKQEFPELRLTIREDLTASLVDRLVSHRLDAALVALPISDDRTESLPLFDEPFWFAEPTDGSPANAGAISEDDLQGKRLLLLTEGHCLREQALAICGNTDRDDDGDFRATSLETIRQMVATGMGSTLLPAMACRDFLSSGVSARPLEGGIGRRIGLVWRRSYPRVADLHLLAQTLLSQLPNNVHRVRDAGDDRLAQSRP